MRHFKKYIKFILSFLILLQISQGDLMAASIEEISVKNKSITAIYEQDKSLPIVSMQVVFQNSGSIFDKEKYGLAKFAANMLNEGTKKDGSTFFATKLENKAISLNAHAGSETLVIEISSLKEHFGFAIECLRELILDPNISSEPFEKVKTMTKGAILSKENDFDYVASLALKQKIYENTPIGHPFLGTKESLVQIATEDVEEFIKKHIVLNNAIVVVGGDIEKSAALNYAKEVLSCLDDGEIGKLGHFEPKSMGETIVQNKESEQAYVYFASPFNLRYDDEEVYKAKVAAFILGAGGFGSRLMEEVRVKRGLAYSAYAKIDISKSSSEFGGYLQTKIASGDKAMKIVKEVISEFVKNGATQKELDGAKKFLLGSEPLRSETLNQRLSRSFMEYYKGFEQGHTRKELEKIEKLDLKILNDFISKHAEITNLTFSVVTNTKDLAEAVEEVGVEKVAEAKKGEKSRKH